MIIGKSPLHRLQKLLDKDVEGYNHRMRLTAYILRDSFPNDPDYVVEKMYQAAEQCMYRHPGRNEIERLVDHAYSVEPNEQIKPIPTADHAFIAEVGRKGDLDELKNQSMEIPESISDILDDLFPDDPFLCICESIWDTSVKTKSEWQKMDLRKYQYILPNTLKTIDGRKSQNIDQVRYLVWESDMLNKDWDLMASIILRLSKILPCKLVLHSGGKSLHSWHRCTNFGQQQLDNFIDTALRLGGDPATLKSTQLVRLPQAIREDNQRQQKVLFYAR